ncbi:MAG: hypothetical protein NC182_07305 [Prevotella sp.]|nr:hypothetical protein [Staphylococcus sp.]MCM1350989.1 hypothetical protein [Prevotella sp.]
MIAIQFNQQEHHVQEPIRVLDLLDASEKKHYTVCRINGQIKELTYVLTERHQNAHIETLGLDNIEGGKAYEATLRYVIAMAFYQLYPDIDIRFSYNVSRSVFCQVLTPGFHLSRATEKIIQEVERIVALDLPIERVTVTIDEAKQIYHQYHHQDKLEILKYRPEHTVHLYKCGQYYDYMHSYMLPSTGCIKHYSIRPYSPGMIIQYPRYELHAEIPEFVEETTYGKTLKRAYLWSSKAKLQTIVDINHKVEENSILDFVQMCEAKHNSMLADLGNNIEADIENIRLIAIAGPSSSGKTTFCNRVRIELLSRGINPVMISMDDYYLEKEEICKIQNKSLEELDLEHINCLDIDLFNKDLYDLINGEEVTLPKFNFQTGKREKGRTIRVETNSPIMIEGIHALNEKLTSSIPKHQKYKIYIAPQAQINIDDHSPLNITDLRLIRRIVRDMKYRNCPAAETIKMWQSVRNGEFKWIYPNQEGANYVFNSELSYELCVLRTKALPALREIKTTDSEYLVANRLIKYLKYFRPIEDESIIPCNSLLREFIGGSCFKL